MYHSDLPYYFTNENEQRHIFMFSRLFHTFQSRTEMYARFLLTFPLNVAKVFLQKFFAI